MYADAARLPYLYIWMKSDFRLIFCAKKNTRLARMAGTDVLLFYSVIGSFYTDVKALSGNHSVPPDVLSGAPVTIRHFVICLNAPVRSFSE